VSGTNVSREERKEWEEKGKIEGRDGEEDIVKRVKKGEKR